jgi:DNA polymerase III sliding clamp (beta) subunit (PCNA family)
MCMLLRPEGLTMVATDGHRLAYTQATPADSGQVNKPFRALVPKKALVHFVRNGAGMGSFRKSLWRALRVSENGIGFVSSFFVAGCCSGDTACGK